MNAMKRVVAVGEARAGASQSALARSGADANPARHSCGNWADQVSLRPCFVPMRTVSTPVCRLLVPL
ncbi:MAG: hypothetical protein CMJ81_10710 [Planctomycetaceae bacterium]|nr:hypothetical protein [Planctomycetaceae bacterium]